MSLAVISCINVFMRHTPLRYWARGNGRHLVLGTISFFHFCSLESVLHEVIPFGGLHLIEAPGACAWGGVCIEGKPSEWPSGANTCVMTLRDGPF